MNLKVQFLTHSRLVKGYLALTYFIKYQYIGMPGDNLDDLFVILNIWAILQARTADFSKNKKISALLA